MYKTKKKFILILCGRQGSGKTTLADLLHNELSYTAHIGVDHIKRFISEFRNIPSHLLVSKKVINAMTAEYIKNEVSVIVEQNVSQAEIEILEQLAKDLGVDFFVYKLEASEEVLKERITERTEKLNKPIIPQEELDEQKTVFDENNYPFARLIDSGLLELREKANLILKDLKVID